MYLPNKYTKWYNSIISNAQSRPTCGYTEQHHIIPKSLGGSNEPSNLVKLSAREHFICHWLLTKMVEGKRPTYQMWNALSSMMYWHRTDSERIKITSHKFAVLKERIAKERSEYGRGVNNTMYGKTLSAETRAKMSKAHTGIKRGPGPKQSDGTKLKRSIAQIGIPKPKITCEHCGKVVGSHGNYTRWHGANCKTINTRY